VELLPRLIRVGRPSLATTGVRSADKPVSPLSWFTSLSCAEVAAHLERYFAHVFHVQQSEVSAAEVEAAQRLVATKYSTPAWVNRLP
jgi:lipoate-protein ligase A